MADQRDMPQRGEQALEGRDEAEQIEEGATPGQVGAADGAAAAGSAGAVPGQDSDDGAIPTEAPDPTVGPD